MDTPCTIRCSTGPHTLSSSSASCRGNRPLQGGPKFMAVTSSLTAVCLLATQSRPENGVCMIQNPDRPPQPVFVLFLIYLSLLSGCSSMGYYYQAARGQLEIWQQRQPKIGRASCRERGETSGGAGA